MGTILSSKVRDDGKIVFEICVDQKEAAQLKGHVDDIYMFSVDADHEKTNLVQRGKNESTMYFLVPKSAREELKKDELALFQKISIPRKKFYIYTVRK